MFRIASVSLLRPKDNGAFNGYVPAGRRVYVKYAHIHGLGPRANVFDSLDAETGLRDRVEVYNIPSTFPRLIYTQMQGVTSNSEFNGDFSHHHPETIEKNLPEIEEFARVRGRDILSP